MGNHLRTDDDFLKEDDDEEPAHDDGQDRDRDDPHDQEAMDMDEDQDPPRSRSDPASPRASPPHDSNGNDNIVDKVTPAISTREQVRRAREAEAKERQKRAREKAKIDLLFAPARGHPPSLYYLPAILLPSQRRFLERRKHVVRFLDLN